MPSQKESLPDNSEQLAELYYTRAQNKLRRGIYKLALTELKEAQQLLEKIYGNQ
jgi:hypothetical protein